MGPELPLAAACGTSSIRPKRPGRVKVALKVTSKNGGKTVKKRIQVKK